MKKNLDFNRNPEGINQHVLRSDEEIQKIIDSKPKNWTKKDFRGEGKLNKEKILTRKETERTGLIFYQTGKRINMKNILNYSTEESIEEFETLSIILGILSLVCCVGCFGYYWYNKKEQYNSWINEDVPRYIVL